MKKTFKRFLACFAALAILCSMVTVFADPVNTVDIEKVEVLTEGSETTVSYENDLSTRDITLTQEQLLKVTISLKNSEDVALNEGDITFLSYTNGTDTSDLSDDNIQYIDQGSVATAENNKVIVTFRPRVTLDTGTFVAKAGGTDAEVDSFTYTVTEAEKNLVLTSTCGPITPSEGDATFTVAVEDSSAAPEGLTSVKIDGNDVDYTYAEGILTIANANVGAVGTHSVVVTATGYKASNAATYTVSAPPSAPITPDQAGDAQAALDKIEFAPEVQGDGTSVIEIPDSVNIGPEDAPVHADVVSKVTVNTNDGAVAYDEATGKITYNPEAENAHFVSKVVITTTIKGENGNDVTSKKTVYLTPNENTTAAFGNFAVIADANGDDAFTTDEKLAAADDNEINNARVEALNITLGRQNMDTVFKAEDTLDYDQDGYFVLAEYRIIKLMFEGTDPLYKVNELKDARAKWLAAHQETPAE